MYGTLFDKECLLKVIQENWLTSGLFFLFLFLFFFNNRVHSRGNKNLPSFLCVFSENSFSQIYDFISNVFSDSVSSVKNILLLTVPVTQLDSEFAGAVVASLSVTTLRRTVSLADPLYFRLFFTVWLISTDMLDGFYAS